VEDGDGARVLGVVHLKDVVKHGMRERFEELRIGWSLDPAASPGGPGISAEAAARVEALVSDALARGAQVVRARAEPPEYGHYVLPALVLGVEPHWPIARQE
ncbi:aldehyde dehydrogenase family protein, partial [Streptomyces exfoliatus]|uniref:aldehyde dehydrogenase family protein n=1 Tax=Streptomyces exfoliatus TaxID=1905 RepID=UPI00055C31B3